MPPNPSGPDLASRAALEALASNLRARRKALGVSVSDLSARSEVSRQAIHAILAGTRCPSIDTVARLAWALGVTPGELISTS